METPKEPTIALDGERVQFILDLVKKNVNAAVYKGVRHRFWVFPPQQYIDDSDILAEANIYERLKDTVWWVKWFDDQYDQLLFGEFLVFIHQVIDSQRAMQEAHQKAELMKKVQHRKSKHAGGWQPPKDRSKKRKPKGKEGWVEFEVEGGFEPSEIRKDSRIRQLLDRVTIERTTRPSQAIN